LKRVIFCLFFLILWVNSFCKDYSRVVSLSPAITDIVSFLGEGKRLVGVTVFCKGKVCRGKERVGGIVNPNVEKIYSLKPNLVLSTTLTPKRELELIKRLGIEVKTFRLVSLKDLRKAVDGISQIFGREKEGETLISKLERESKRFLSCLKGKKVVVIVSNRPFYAAGRNSYLGELLSFAGALTFPNGSFLPVSAEGIESLKPDLIIVVGKRESKVLKRLGSRIVLFKKPDELLHPSPVLLKGIRDLGRAVCGN
jgi:iron complex transport system substrate-binding protein